MSLRLILLNFFVILLVRATNAEKRRSKFSSFLVFGDSTVDPGNNDYVPLTIVKSNFRPYGRDFPGKVPTGRFSNGKLVTDFIASYLGIKDTIPPYLDPNLTEKDLATGVSFASAGTGFDPLTSKIVNVIPVTKQLEYFKEYISRLESFLGKEKTKNLIQNAAVAISGGTNDFILNYFLLPLRNKTFTVDEYENFVLEKQINLAKSLIDLGVQLVAVVGLPPFGCLPAAITLESGTILPDCKCIERYSVVAKNYNTKLQAELASLQSNGVTTFYIDIFNPLNDLIKRPKLYGFEVVNKGCCGSGILETAVLCNPLVPACKDASKYVFFDSVHPSEATYYQLFRTTIPLLNRFII